LLPKKWQLYSSHVAKFIVGFLGRGGGGLSVKNATGKAVGRNVLPYLYKYRISYQIRGIFSDKSPQKSLCVLTPDDKLLISGLLNPHKYLANYMAPNITCSVL
jgi:hypothetical protein